MRRNPERTQLGQDYLWNTSASLLAALSTVIMLAVVTRSAGTVAGGVYSFALAVGQQFQTLGMFEVRTYHVTDVKPLFRFGTYLATRILTVSLMLLGIIGYSLRSGGGPAAVLLVALIASLRLFDAFEDVYYSEFQRVGRLDLGGRASCVRTLCTMLSFCLSLVLTHSLLLSTVITLVVSTVALGSAYLPVARGLFPLSPDWQWSRILRVLRECLPIFLGSFIAMYLANAPRYAINTYMDDQAQGVFAIIYMPAVAINMLSLFIYRPLVTRMALQWSSGDRVRFRGSVRQGLTGTVVAFAVVALATVLLGPQVLKLVFGEDVSGLLTELLVLVAAGAMNAASVVLFYALTTMRRQRVVFLCYSLAALVVFALCPVLVSTQGLLGAALSYLGAMTTLVLSFVLSLCIRCSPRQDALTP